MAAGGCIATAMSCHTLLMMIVLGCCVIQTKCDVFASKSTYVVEGVVFGEAKMFIDTNDYVYHMEFDVADPKQLIFSDENELKSSDGLSTTTFIGSTDYGYLEAKGVAARFHEITGFTQQNRTSIIVVDRGNHCLRHVDKAGWQTSPFVGQCTKYGYKDGRAALFRSPYSVIRDQRFSNKLLVTEYYYNRVRQVDTLTRETITLLDTKSGVANPYGLAFDLQGKGLIISNSYSVDKFDIKSKSYSRLSGENGRGALDCKLKDSEFNDLRELVFLTDSLILVADSYNNRLRIINTAADSVSSICEGISSCKSKPADSCSLENPLSLLVKDDLIYIGADGSIQTIPFSLQQLKVCPDDISVSLDEGQSLANGDFRAPSGVLIRVPLPVGEHTLTYNLDQEAECNFTISVKDYSRIRHRLEFSAEYDVKCSEIESQSVHSLFISTAQQHSKHIDDLCSSECKVVGDVKESCSNDTVTVTWSTDLVLPAVMREIPEQVKNKILHKLNQYHGLLNVVITTKVPPLVYPKIGKDGRAIKLVLTQFCVGGFKYDAVTKTCV